MFGWGYVNDVCIALFKKEQEEKLYKNYVAECIRITTENTAKCVLLLSRGEYEANYFSISFSDLLNPRPVVEKTEKEIIDEIQAEFERLGFESKKELQQIGGENT